MPDSISIIIPTHNRAEVLMRAVESLRAIQRPPHTTIELLIIANACTDGTVGIIERMASGFPFALRCIAEPQIGLNHARNCGLRSSGGDVIAFLDDDVSVDPLWLLGLLDAFRTPAADIVAGKVILCWNDVVRPNWLSERSEHLLSCVDHGNMPLELHKPGLAVGANMAFRRRVFDSVGSFSNNLDRTGGLILGGGDTDLLTRALEAGFRMFYAPVASLLHHVAPPRAKPEYLCAASYGNGLTRVFFQKKLSMKSVLWIFAQQSYRAMAYSLLAGFAALLGMRRASISYRIRRCYSCGLLVGTARRLRGHSPAGLLVAKPVMVAKPI